MKQKEVARQLAERMNVDEATAIAWIEALTETVYDNLKVGESVNLLNFGTFYVREECDNWVFKFNPSQRLRALFGWSSTYKGER